MTIKVPLLPGMLIMPGPPRAYRPNFHTALVILCQQLVTRHTVTSQLHQCSRLVLL
jgi:hypothetical protein